MRCTTTSHSTFRRTTVAVLLATVALACIFTADAQAVYHPRLGRFMQRDPVGYRDGMGLYEPVASNPLVFTDPQGTQYGAGTDCHIEYCRASTKWINRSYDIGHSWVEAVHDAYGWSGGSDIYDAFWGHRKADIRNTTTIKAKGKLTFGTARGKACCYVTCDEIEECLPLAGRYFASTKTYQPNDPHSLSGILHFLWRPKEPRGGVTCVHFARFILENCCLLIAGDVPALPIPPVDVGVGGHWPVGYRSTTPD